MKNIKIIVTTLALILSMVSCTNDGGESNLNLQEGAVPNVQKDASTDSFINLIDISNGKSINLGVTFDQALGKIKSLDVVAFYEKDGKISKVVLKADINIFPTTINITEKDIIAAFPTISSTSDFALGDKLTITADVTTNTGTIIKILNDDGTPNYGQDISNSLVYKVTQTYFVSCPSDLAGTYTVISSGASTDSGPDASVNPIANYSYEVKITADGGGAYTLSDGYAGLYQLWYDIYGITGENSGNFTDVCGTLSGSYSEPFGTTVTLTGTVNADNTLSIRWENGYGDFGESIFTKK